MLHGRRGIAVTYLVFDVLQRRGTSTMDWPYWRRRELLERLELNDSN